MARSARLLLTAAAAIGAMLAALIEAAQAQTYPNRPIRFVVSNPPGGASDLIVRIIGPPLGERLGQNIIVDHRPGANGNISAEVVAKSAPDGYTLLYANNSLLVVNPHIYSKSTVDVMKDLVPVATSITNQLVLAANPKIVPSNDLAGFIEQARQAKGSLFYASIGNGSQHHLAMEMLKQMAKIDMTHVPYRGGGPASISVIAGDNAVMFGGASVVQHIKSGKLKGLAVTEKKGWPTMPELPGIGEVLPGYRVGLWHVLLAPRGTPQAIVDKLRTELNAVLKIPEVRDRLISTGSGEPYITTQQELQALVRTDYDQFGKLVKSIGFKVD
ncbi:MAG: tripartite tricarboxylate transporter substrate binding protein [Alphaproteobacteria bacterium]|nr:tripartite tricarboxylate transporter substrate binding protein [Alphaproteobacteria bacterium]